jgi:hypothetical protein
VSLRSGSSTPITLVIDAANLGAILDFGNDPANPIDGQWDGMMPRAKLVEKGSRRP